MKPESIVFALAGVFLGLIAGWLLGSQQPARKAVSAAAPPPAAAQQPAARPAALDTAEVERYRSLAERDPSNATPRLQLGNLYFDAEQYGEAITWYEKAFELDPTNADVSTDLGVSYYYTNQADRALAQFEKSLAIDPRHTKTMLNRGIVLAFGKQDLEGAAKAWERVVELAPNTPEGQAARRALDSLKAAHPNMTADGPAAGS
jgi:tetratricopeptide (TPR) repeat protein